MSRSSEETHQLSRNPYSNLKTRCPSSYVICVLFSPPTFTTVSSPDALRVGIWPKIRCMMVFLLQETSQNGFLKDHQTVHKLFHRFKPHFFFGSPLHQTLFMQFSSEHQVHYLELLPTTSFVHFRKDEEKKTRSQFTQINGIGR